MLALLVLSLIGSVVLVVLSQLFTPLAVLVGLVMTLAVIAAVLVVVAGGGYLVWRDTFGDEAGAPPSMPAVPHHIEV